MKNWFMNLSLARKLVYSFLLVGLVPMIIVSTLAINTASQQLRQQALDQLEAVREIKSGAVERYFDFVKNQILVMANSPEIQTATGDFKDAFTSVVTQEGLDTSDIFKLRNELNQYYTQQFAEKYQQENQGNAVNTDSLLGGISDTAAVLQHAYIQASPHPLGDKHLLDKAEGAAQYHQQHAIVHPGIRDFLEKFGYYDIFIVDPETGKIVYSVFKELDYATSLLTGPYANTNFAEAFKRARNLAAGDVIIEDYQPYLPSYEAPASFAATPIVKQGVTQGVLIFQMPLEPINAIMSSRAGMGKTGESYLVGPNHLMRSDSYLDAEKHTVSASFKNPDQGAVNTQPVTDALSGKHGKIVTANYAGDTVLSAYGPLSVGGFTWAIIAEISSEEAFAGVTQLRNTVIVVAIIGIALILFAAIYIAKIMSAPILKLSASIQQVAADGNFQLHNTNHHSDEIGVTSRAFYSLLGKLSQAISNTNQVLDNLGQGHFNQRVSGDYPGELATLSRGVNSAVEQVAQAHKAQQAQAQLAKAKAEETAVLAEQAQQQAQDALIVKQALDVSATAVMIADENFNIVYLNDSNQQLMRDIETSLQQSLPNFRAENLVGQSIDRFHQNPSHNRQLMQNLTDSQRSQIKISGLTINLTTSPIRDDKGRFLGAVVEWQNITEQLQQEAQTKRIAEENQRIRQALDSSSTSTMIADENFNIIYMNGALDQMMREAESDIRQELPQFNMQNLMGANIDTFHKKPQHQRQLISGLNQAYNTQITVGERTFALSVNPVHSDSGQRIGAVVEWSDRSEEVHIEREIDGIIKAATAGDFSKSVDLSNKSGFFRTIAEGLNGILNTTNHAMNDVLGVFSALANGNLNRNIEGDYEGVFAQLKTDANTSMDKLRTVMHNISNSSSSIARSAAEISSGNADLSRRTEEQASSLEQTAASMEQMINIVRKSGENATQVNTLTMDSVDIARQGNDSVQATAKAMSEISEASSKIANIIGVIDEIAFQTNLLALNAAVEAARAGEQGRGFAVVAGEVRNLAQRSASAAKEIKDLIQDSESKVEDGSRLVQESGDRLHTIVLEIEKVGKTISEIAQSAQEQTQGIEQVNQAVEQMDQMTQQNAALVEEASAASESMAAQTKEMDQMIAFFRS
ncbi:MAG: PAS domain-containing protein [Cellvibrionaceae bacterium]|nr:PAS domain-containing protein [Cellvibrionaceae bacterium]